MRRSTCLEKHSFPNWSQDQWSAWSNPKWSAEINPVRAKIHLPRCGSRSIRDGQTLRSLNLQLLPWKGLVQVQCSLSILYLSFFDARDVIPLYMLHLRFTLIISIRSAPSMIKCSDSASKHYLLSLEKHMMFARGNFFLHM